MRIEKTALKWLQTPPVKWDSKLKRKEVAPGDWQGLCRHLDAIAQEAAMLSEYIGTRKGVDGTGEHDHETAVKEANRRLTAVRRALGFAIPKAGTFNF